MEREIATKVKTPISLSCHLRLELPLPVSLWGQPGVGGGVGRLEVSSHHYRALEHTGMKTYGGGERGGSMSFLGKCLALVNITCSLEFVDPQGQIETKSHTSKSSPLSDTCSADSILSSCDCPHERVNIPAIAAQNVEGLMTPPPKTQKQLVVGGF